MIRTIFILIAIMLAPQYSSISKDSWSIVHQDYYRKYIDADNYDSLNCVCIASTINRYRVYKTTNGGLDWDEMLPDSIAFLEPEVRGGKLKLKKISYPEKDHFVIACDSGWVIRTTDGGIHWQRHYANDMKGNVGHLNMMNRNTGFMEVNTDLGRQSKLYKTTNGSMTWQEVDLPVKSILIWDMEIAESNVIYLYSHILDSDYNKYYSLIKSHDNGENWEVTKLDFISSSKDISFINKDVGWVSVYLPVLSSYSDEYDNMYMTTDGGLSWTEQLKQEIKPYYGLETVSFFDSKNGIAAGKEGKIIMTTDGGLTWQREFCKDSNIRNYNINKAIMMSSDVALVFCNDECIYRYDRSLLHAGESIEPTKTYLHPNPATSQITFSPGEGFISEPEIDIIDYLGNAYKLEYEINGSEITINTSLLSPGVYFLRVRSGEKIEVKKFVVL
jgi:photosystem II stability/assembly factor-like uncharacterized protein